MVMSPMPISAAPHTHIATVYAAEAAEGAILRDLSNLFPNVTAIRVREAAERVTEALSTMATATSYAALATLLTGFVVLIGAAAAGERARVFEAAVMKTLGASRAAILTSFCATLCADGGGGRDRGAGGGRAGQLGGYALRDGKPLPVRALFGIGHHRGWRHCHADRRLAVSRCGP